MGVRPEKGYFAGQKFKSVFRLNHLQKGHRAKNCIKTGKQEVGADI